MNRKLEVIVNGQEVHLDKDIKNNGKKPLSVPTLRTGNNPLIVAARAELNKIVRMTAN